MRPSTLALLPRCAPGDGSGTRVPHAPARASSYACSFRFSSVKRLVLGGLDRELFLEAFERRFDGLDGRRASCQVRISTADLCSRVSASVCICVTSAVCSVCIRVTWPSARSGTARSWPRARCAAAPAGSMLGLRPLAGGQQLRDLSRVAAALFAHFGDGFSRATRVRVSGWPARSPPPPIAPTFRLQGVQSFAQAIAFHAAHRSPRWRRRPARPIREHVRSKPMRHSRSAAARDRNSPGS